MSIVHSSNSNATILCIEGIFVYLYIDRLTAQTVPFVLCELYELATTVALIDAGDSLFMSILLFPFLIQRILFQIQHLFDCSIYKMV